MIFLICYSYLWYFHVYSSLLLCKSCYPPYIVTSNTTVHIVSFSVIFRVPLIPFLSLIVSLSVSIKLELILCTHIELHEYIQQWIYQNAFQNHCEFREFIRLNGLYSGGFLNTEDGNGGTLVIKTKVGIIDDEVWYKLTWWKSKK